MSQQIEMQALRDFTHVGRAYVRGERFSIEPAHAAALSFTQHARLLEPGDVEPSTISERVVENLKAEPAPRTPRPRKNPSKRGTYRRRDLAPSRTT